MKIKIVKFIFVPLFLLLLSCDGKSVFREFERFESNRWFKNKVQTYDVTIDETGLYDVMIDFSHVHGVKLPEIPVQLAIESAEKKTIMATAVLELKDLNGNDLSDCTGDICDLKQTVIKSESFSAGKYTIRLSQTFAHEYLPNVIGVGIRLHPSANN